MEHEREVLLPAKTLSWADKPDGDYITSKPPVAVATTGASTADVLTSTSHETQTRNRDLEPKGETVHVLLRKQCCFCVFCVFNVRVIVC